MTAVNDPPTISDISNQTINEDSNTGALSFTVTDIDNDLDTLILSATSPEPTIIPTGNIAFSGSGTNRTVTVTPVADKNTYSSGPVNLTITVTDAGSLTASDSFTVTITAINDLPTAVNDTATTVEDTAKSISVLANDSDVDIANEGDNLTILSVAGVDNGQVDIAGDKKSLTFTPVANWNGAETFTYTLRDNENQQSTASVTVTVTPVNDAPVAVSDADEINEDNPITVYVLVNDSDVDGDDLTISSATGASHGSISLAGDKKSLTYTPSADWNGIETFNYTIKDSSNATATSSVVITVKAVNDAPAAVADSMTISEDQVSELTVLANDTDVDLAHEGDSSFYCRDR